MNRLAIEERALVKLFGQPELPERRYSPAKCNVQRNYRWTLMEVAELADRAIAN